MMNYPVIMLGWGGHARVLYEIIKLNNMKILAISCPNIREATVSDFPQVKIIDDADILGYEPKKIRLVNGLGSIDVNSRREQIFNEFKEQGYDFINIIHPLAILSSNVQLGEGVQIMAGAIVQPGNKIGDNVLINTGAILDHDCMVSDHTHLATGVVVSGNVSISTGVHLGTGAKIINNVSIGANCTIGAGAVLIEDAPPNSRLVGVPARLIGENTSREA